MRTEAEGEKQKDVLAGEAEGEAIRARLAGEAEGRKEILMKMAEGFDAIVEAANGDAQAAATLMIVDKLDEIVHAQAQAISNIDFEKVVVYDSGDGKAVSGFLGGLTQALPPLHQLAQMGGVELPDYLGEMIADEKKKSDDDDEEEVSSPSVQS